MKKYIILFIVLFFVSFTACEKFLKEDGSTQLTADVTKTPAGFDASLTAVYSTLRNVYGNLNWVEWMMCGTDEAALSSIGSDSYSPTTRNSSSTSIRDYWNLNYIGINRANTVIDAGAVVQGLTENVKNQKLAEAKFLRALFYSNLVRGFGDVPLRLNKTTGLIADGTRTPRRDVFNAIIADLDWARQYLPYTQTQYGRATRYAAFHLLAKIYLTRAWTDVAEASDFQKVIQFGDSVRLKYNGGAALGKSTITVKDIWDENTSNTNVAKEVLFAIQYSNVLADEMKNFGQQRYTVDANGNTVPLVENPTGGSNTVGGNCMNALFTFKIYSDQEGNVFDRDLRYGRPYQYAVPSPEAIKFYDKDNDSRYSNYFWEAMLANKAGALKQQKTWKDPITGLDVTGFPLKKVGDTAVFYPRTDISPAVAQRRLYRIINPSTYTYTTTGITTKKYSDTKRSSGNSMIGMRDLFVFRLSDTYLMQAEAYFKMNDNVNAMARLNSIRIRAAVAGKESLFTLTDPAQVTLDLILDERLRELLFEGERFFDLSRTHTLVRRAKLYNAVVKNANFINDFHELLPIPQAEIDGSFGTSIQNPGY